MGRISAEFCAAYPEVTFEVVAEDRLVDLVEEQFDTVIRKDCAGLSAWRCSATHGMQSKPCKSELSIVLWARTSWKMPRTS